MGRNLSGSPCTNFSYLFFLLCLSLFACQMPTKDFGVCVYRTPTERRLVVFFLLCEKIIFPSRSFEKQGAKKVVQLTNSLFLCCGKKTNVFTLQPVRTGGGEEKSKSRTSSGKIITPKKKNARFSLQSRGKGNKLTTNHCTWL